jgi:hypothetical protein
MTEVEHYAISLCFIWLVGASFGVANQAVVDQKAGKGQSFDLAHMIGAVVSFGYLIYGFKFVDGRYFIWVIALLILASGYRLGREVAINREDPTTRVIILGANAAAPLLYHLVLV